MSIGGRRICGDGRMKDNGGSLELVATRGGYPTRSYFFRQSEEKSMGRTRKQLNPVRGVAGELLRSTGASKPAEEAGKEKDKKRSNEKKNPFREIYEGKKPEVGINLAGRDPRRSRKPWGESETGGAEKKRKYSDPVSIHGKEKKKRVIAGRTTFRNPPEDGRKRSKEKSLWTG